jgi:spermidine/putrescine-binding protein
MDRELPDLISAELAALDRAALSRRALLARTGGALLATSTFASALAASARAAVEADEAVKGTLRLLVWQGYDDPKAAKPLTARGLKISATYITNNDEIVSKLRAGGLGSIDIVTPYFGYIEPLVKSNLLQPIDYSRLPSAKTFFKEFLHQPWNTFAGKTYSVPLVWGDMPITYRSDLFKDRPASWLDCRDKKYRGQLVTLDDPLGNIILFSKALYGGKNVTRITKKQLTDVGKVLKEVKRNLVQISASFGDIADMMVRGDAYACLQGWRFLQVQIKAKGKPAQAYVPKPGTFIWCDNYCIPRNAPNLDGAYAFINTMVAASGDAIVGADTGSGVTNGAAVKRLPANQKALYPYAGISAYIRANGFYPLPPLSPQGNSATFKDWLSAWEDVKSA